MQVQTDIIRGVPVYTQRWDTGRGLIRHQLNINVHFLEAEVSRPYDIVAIIEYYTTHPDRPQADKTYLVC